MDKRFKDYTGQPGQLQSLAKSLSKPKWPMYSFDRPSYNFWNGAANYLRDSGMSDDEIGEVLMSKDARWMLDNGPINDSDIEQLGYNAMQQYKSSSQ